MLVQLRKKLEKRLETGWERERPMIQVRNQGGQPGKGTGISAGVENSSWAEREAGLWLRCVAGMGSVAGRGLGLEGVLLGGVWLG